MSKFSITRRQILILLLISIVMASTTACASRQIELQEPPIQHNSTSNDTTDAESTTTTDPISDHQTNKDSQGTEDKNTSSSNKNDKESDEVEDEPEKSELTMHTDVKTFQEIEGKTLTMSIDIPQNWTFRTDNPNAIDQYIDDENGMKVAGSFGIVQFLKKDESLETLQNIAGFLTPTQTSSFITLDQRKYLLETSIIGDSNKEIIMAYNYSFVENDAVINFYFYNIGDKRNNIALYEKILKSINITIK